jgi:hypothetical protein
MIEIKLYRAIKYMVSDSDGQLRGFNTKQQAIKFIEDKPDCWIDYIPAKTLLVEECLI